MFHGLECDPRCISQSVCQKELIMPPFPKEEQYGVCFPLRAIPLAWLVASCDNYYVCASLIRSEKRKSACYHIIIKRRLGLLQV